MEKDFISIILPTYRHPWELRQVMFSLEDAQIGVFPEEYEIIIVNDSPKELETRQVAIDFYKVFKNVRYIEVHDAHCAGFTNSVRCGNIGIRSYARNDIIILVVDSSRIFTPRIIQKTKDAFLTKGRDIVTTVYPYQIGREQTDPNWTPEKCRKLMNDIRWKEDPYRLFDVKVDTYISQTGIIKESTFQGMTREAWLEVGGSEESFKTWTIYNIDLWRRCTMPRPKDGIQVVGVPGQWGKVGIGMEVVLLEGEASFHIQHDVFVPRDHSRFMPDLEKVWDIYKERGDCIHANADNPNWGINECSKEIDLEKL